MKRTISALALASALASCTGGNPNDAQNDEGVGTGTQPLTQEPATETTDDTTDQEDTQGTNPDANSDEVGADTDTNNLYATASDNTLTANRMAYDAATDEVVFNNLPFDGQGNTYNQNAARSAGIAATGNNYRIYDSDFTSTNGFKYFAVFQRSASGFVQAGATQSDRYVGFGFGGASAQRLEGTGELPAADEFYVFTGDYAAVRTTSYDASTVAAADLEYVAGDVLLEVDIEDFDSPGAVEGVVFNRTYYDANGIEDAARAGEDVILLQTAQIDFDDWTIVSSTASMTATAAAGQSGTGTWEGIFAGPNGEEVAGIVVIDGSAEQGVNTTTGSATNINIRELGTFLVER